MEAVKVFNDELATVYDTKPPISRAKMSKITKSAIKAIKFYKHVVQSVEKFIQKCRPEYKVPGLYVVDSIVRQSRHQFGIDKDVFAARFTKNIANTFTHLFKCPTEERSKIVRVLNLWQKNNVFSSSVVQPLLDLAADPHNQALMEKVARDIQLATGLTPSVPMVGKVEHKHSASKTVTSHSHANLQADVMKAISQLVQQSQQETLSLSAQQQQLQQLQLLQQQLMAQSQALSHPGGNKDEPLIDAGLLSQIQTLTNQLLQKTQDQESQPQEPAFNKNLLDFDYGDSDEEDNRKDHGASNSLSGNLVQHLSDMSASIQRSEAMKAELSMQEMRQRALEEEHDAFTREISGAPPLPPGGHHDGGHEHEEGEVMNSYGQQMGQETEYDRRMGRGPSGRRRDRSRSRSPKRRRRSRSRSRDRRRRSRSRDRYRRSRSRERERDRAQREKERERRRLGLPPMKEKHLSICTTTIWLGHLSKMTGEEHVGNLVSTYGEVISIHVVPPRGCAFVCFRHRNDANRAVERLKGEKLLGNILKVAWAPGKGVNVSHFKANWDVDMGVTYIPWTEVPDDLTALTQGGIFDKDTLPPGHKEAVKNDPGAGSDPADASIEGLAMNTSQESDPSALAQQPPEPMLGHAPLPPGPPLQFGQPPGMMAMVPPPVGGILPPMMLPGTNFPPPPIGMAPLPSMPGMVPGLPRPMTTIGARLPIEPPVGVAVSAESSDVRMSVPQSIAQMNNLQNVLSSLASAGQSPMRPPVMAGATGQPMRPLQDIRGQLQFNQRPTYRPPGMRPGADMRPGLMMMPGQPPRPGLINRPEIPPQEGMGIIREAQPNIPNMRFGTPGQKPPRPMLGSTPQLQGTQSNVEMRGQSQNQMSGTIRGLLGLAGMSGILAGVNHSSVDNLPNPRSQSGMPMGRGGMMPNMRFQGGMNNRMGGPPFRPNFQENDMERNGPGGPGVSFGFRGGRMPGPDNVFDRPEDDKSRDRDRRERHDSRDRHMDRGRDRGGDRERGSDRNNRDRNDRDRNDRDRNDRDRHRDRSDDRDRDRRDRRDLGRDRREYDNPRRNMDRPDRERTRKSRWAKEEENDVPQRQVDQDGFLSWKPPSIDDMTLLEPFRPVEGEKQVGPNADTPKEPPEASAPGLENVPVMETAGLPEPGHVPQNAKEESDLSDIPESEEAKTLDMLDDKHPQFDNSSESKSNREQAVEQDHELASEPAHEETPQSSHEQVEEPTHGQVSEPAPELVSEPTFEQASEPAFEQTSSEPAFEQAASEPTFEQAASEPTFEQAASEPTFEQAASESTFEQAASEPTFEQASSEPTFEQAASEPVHELHPEPAFQQASEPAFQQASEPTFEQAAEPIHELPSEPAFEQASEPAFEQASEPTFEQAAEPAFEQVSEPALEPVREPMDQEEHRLTMPDNENMNELSSSEDMLVASSSSLSAESASNDPTEPSIADTAPQC